MAHVVSTSSILTADRHFFGVSFRLTLCREIRKRLGIINIITFAGLEMVRNSLQHLLVVGVINKNILVQENNMWSIYILRSFTLLPDWWVGVLIFIFGVDAQDKLSAIKSYNLHII